MHNIIYIRRHKRHLPLLFLQNIYIYIYIIIMCVCIYIYICDIIPVVRVSSLVCSCSRSAAFNCITSTKVQFTCSTCVFLVCSCWRSTASRIINEKVWLEHCYNCTFVPVSKYFWSTWLGDHQRKGVVYCVGHVIFLKKFVLVPIYIYVICVLCYIYEMCLLCFIYM